MEIGDQLVDVAIITYGNYDGLGQTVDSILNQTQPIGTVLLSDDGSGHPFPQEEIERLKRGSFRMALRSGERNLGTVKHINTAAGKLESDYLKIMASGDAFADSEALESLVRFAQRENSVVVTSDSEVCSPDLKTRHYRFPGPRRGRCLAREGGALYATLAAANIVSAAGTLFRRDFFEERGGLDEAYYLLDDWPAWLRLAREVGRIPYLSRVTALYAMGGVSSADSNAFRAPKLRADMRLCYEKEILPYLDSLPFSVRRTVAYHYRLLTGEEAQQIWMSYPLLSAKDAAKRWLKKRLTG